MKKIVLLCAGGMSTGILINKMKEYAATIGKEYDINAYSLAQQDVYGPSADVILVGPQVRYAIGELQEKFTNKPIESIDMRTYGTMDGKAVLNFAMKLLGDK